MDCSKPVPGIAITLYIIDSSFNSGINSLPCCERTKAKMTKRTLTLPSSNFACLSAKTKRGVYPPFIFFIMILSAEAVGFKSKNANTGTKTSATSKEPSITNTILSAIGEYNFPANPSRLRRGINTAAIINTANVTGFATSLAASAISFKRGVSGLSCSLRKVFSTITIVPSTIIPTAIAKPLRLIKLALTP